MYQHCPSFAESCNINLGAYVLINEHYSYVLPPLRKVVEGLPNCRVLGFGVDYEKVLLCLWRLSDMLCILISSVSLSHQGSNAIPQYQLVRGQSQSPEYCIN